MAIGVRKQTSDASGDARLSYARPLLRGVMLFFLLAFLLLWLKSYDERALMLAVIVPVIIYIGVQGIPRLFPADRLLLSLTNFLCALGVLVLYRLSPERGLQQAVNFGVGVAAMLICTVAVRYIRGWKGIVLLLVPASIGLLALPLLYGTEVYGAKNWVTIAGFGFQPSELVKLSLIVILSWLLSRRKVALSILVTGVCLGLLMLQKDLGTALLYYGVALLAIWAATDSGLLLALGCVGAGGAGVLGYRMFAHVKRRVAVWLNPWSDRQGSGYQIVQGLIAIANGGLFGTGLGLGNPGVIPASYNDYIFAVICHEFGVLFGIVVLLFFLALIMRGISIARQSDSVFHSLLALCCTALIGLQTFVIVGGNIKLIPLTGVTLPFISYGGTSLVSSMCLIGFLQGVAARNTAQLAEAEKRARFEEERP
ncbi:MAG: FtsW/RodA/SpoVE family cell cycle protein [Clostridia bacterium]|nr:FtsW/RodA/SpoVE family cell cycle protein [Clostridia bacterium]